MTTRFRTKDGSQAGLFAETATGQRLDPASVRDASGDPIPVPQPAPALNLKLEEPSLAEMASNVAKATGNWALAGFPVVDQPTYDARSAACTACDLWDPTARLGLGKCHAPGCGCTSLKRWLATEKCPLSKWPATPLPPPGNPPS